LLVDLDLSDPDAGIRLCADLFGLRTGRRGAGDLQA